jgi:hypothetical protein
MREPNRFKERTDFAVKMTSSLRKGIPTSHLGLDHVKKKRRLFSVPIPPCRSLVALPRHLPLWSLASFWNLDQIPFRWNVVRARFFTARSKQVVEERLPSA